MILKKKSFWSVGWREGKNKEDLIGSEMDLLCEPLNLMRQVFWRTYCVPRGPPVALL